MRAIIFILLKIAVIAALIYLPVVLLAGCEAGEGRSKVKMSAFFGAALVEVDVEASTPFGSQKSRSHGVIPVAGIVFHK